MTEVTQKFADKIAQKLNVDPSAIIAGEIISPTKIADILESRGHYSYLDKVCLADCLNAHYKGVTKLLDKYWSKL